MSKFDCNVCPASFSSGLGLDHHYEDHIWIVAKEEPGNDEIGIGSSKSDSYLVEPRKEADQITGMTMAVFKFLFSMN
jgi:hypothetical protein